MTQKLLVNELSSMGIRKTTGYNIRPNIMAQTALFVLRQISKVTTIEAHKTRNNENDNTDYRGHLYMRSMPLFP